jgi:hypothetical protein
MISLDFIERCQHGSDKLGIVSVLPVVHRDDADRFHLFPLDYGHRLTPPLYRWMGLDMIDALLNSHILTLLSRMMLVRCGRTFSLFRRAGSIERPEDYRLTMSDDLWNKHSRKSSGFMSIPGR